MARQNTGLRGNCASRLKLSVWYEERKQAAWGFWSLFESGITISLTCKGV